MSSIPWGSMLAPRAGCLPMGWIPYDMCHSQDECSPTGLDAHLRGWMLTHRAGCSPGPSVRTARTSQLLKAMQHRWLRSRSHPPFPDHGRA